jgi:hypothetical protein
MFRIKLIKKDANDVTIVTKVFSFIRNTKVQNTQIQNYLFYSFSF